MTSVLTYGSIDVDNDDALATFLNQLDCHCLVLLIDNGDLVVDDQLSGTHLDLTNLVLSESISDEFVGEDDA